MITEQATEQSEPDFMTIPKFLEVINQNGKVLSREFVYRAAQKGKIPTYRINKKIFVRFPEVLAALRQGS